MSLDDNLTRRKIERERKAAEAMGTKHKWDTAVEKQLIDVQDKLKDTFAADLLKVQPMPERRPLDQLRITEPGGKTIAFKPEPDRHLIILKPEGTSLHARALYWDEAGLWWLLLEAANYQASHYGTQGRFDYDNKQEYSTATLKAALDLLLE